MSQILHQYLLDNPVIGIDIDPNHSSRCPLKIAGMEGGRIGIPLGMSFIMKKRTRLFDMPAHFCRTYRQTFAINVRRVLAFVLFCCQSFAAPLPEFDPLREWLGIEYADTVVAHMKANHPDLPLVIDLHDLEYFKHPHDGFTFKQALQEFRLNSEFQLPLLHRLMDFARNILPATYQPLIAALESGSRIPISGERWEMASRLLTWVESQPENSITPHRLMEEALLLTEGRVLAAWALAWNVIREGWPAAGTRNYGFIRNFVSLTGERNYWRGAFNYVVLSPGERSFGETTVTVNNRNEERIKSKRYLKMVVTKRGDDFSYLYHRLGVELLAMVVSKHSQSAILGRGAGSVGAFAEWFKFRQTSGLSVENQKRLGNDFTAATSGARLYQLIEGKSAPAIQLTKNSTEVTLYLKPNPRKFGRKYLLVDGRPASYFGSKVNPKFWKASMSVEELTYRFHHATRYDAEIFSPVLLAGGEDYERLHRGLTDYMKSSEQSPELNSYLQDYLSGKRGNPFVLDVSHDIDLGIWDSNHQFARTLDKEFEFTEFNARMNRLLTRVLVEKKALGSRGKLLPSYLGSKPEVAPGPLKCSKAHL